MSENRHQCEFRFYEELGEFLSPEQRGCSFTHAFDGTPAVKDRIEALGVPHTEVDAILVDREPVTFAHKLRGGERVAVFPAGDRVVPAPALRLRPGVTGEPRFVLDVHLGRLASYLRLLGFDCLYRNDYTDQELLAISRTERRTLLTRDTGLLKRSAITHGAFLHATDPRRQLREVCDRFQLHERATPFTRCARCNGRVGPIPVATDLEAPDGVIAGQEGKGFSRCWGCGQLYWAGSHLTRLRTRLAEVGVVI